MQTYTWWGGNYPPPSHLKTPNQLKKLGLYPKQAVGVIYRKGISPLYLYDPRDPNSVMIAAVFQAQWRYDRNQSARWAKALLERDDWVILDTETTGLRKPQICQIAIINPNGETLVDTFVKPTKPIEAKATQVHGITNEMVKNAPFFSQVYPDILNAIACREVLIYNAEFDVTVLKECSRYTFAPIAKGFTDVMVRYAKYKGEWNGYRADYAYPKLGGNHSAKGDCLAVLQILKEMADSLEEER